MDDSKMDGSKEALAAADERMAQPQGGPLNNGEPDGKSGIGSTSAAEAMLQDEADALTRTAIEMAKEGNPTALRMCIERLFPIRRDRRVAFEMPTIKTAADALDVSAKILVACAEGTLAPTEAAEILKLIETHVRIIQTVDLEARVVALEKGPRL